MPYIYQSELWCDSCGQAIRERITAEGHAPENPDDETSYDSDEFPKYASTDGETDSPSHCGSGNECLEAIELSDGTKVGALISENLTTDGADYVRQAVKEGGLVAVEVWKPAFDWVDYEDEEEDEEDED